MKVGFGAYAVGVLFMDSLLSIISITPWISDSPFPVVSLRMQAMPKPERLPATVPTSLAMQSINIQRRGPGLEHKVSGWLNTHTSLIYCQSDHPLGAAQNSQPFEEKMDNVPQSQ